MSTTIHEEQPNGKSKQSTPKTEKEAKTPVSDSVKTTANAVSGQARAARDAAGETLDGVRDGVTQATDKARSIAQEQPLLAVAGAMAIGVALGFALGNRRS